MSEGIQERNGEQGEELKRHVASELEHRQAPVSRLEPQVPEEEIEELKNDGADDERENGAVLAAAGVDDVVFGSLDLFVNALQIHFKIDLASKHKT